MEQMTKANGIDICFETFGEATNPTVLFVMGLGAQMLAWPEMLINGVVDAGFHVVQYDNRDVGRSHKFDEAGLPDFDALIKDLLSGNRPQVPYYLEDMAADGIGLLDALGIEKAHIVGASMGGMIVQQMAIDSGDRVTSMTSIMSTTGDPSVPQASQEAMDVLTTPAPQTDDVDVLLDFSMKNREVIGGDGFVDDEEVRAHTLRMMERSTYPVGMARQRAGIMASGPRTEALKSVTTPTLVIHGDKDPLVRVEGGKHTAQTIPGAQLEILEGMGHAMYPMYQPRILELIREFATGHEPALAAAK